MGGREQLRVGVGGGGGSQRRGRGGVLDRSCTDSASPGSARERALKDDKSPEWGVSFLPHLVRASLHLCITRLEAEPEAC